MVTAFKESFERELDALTFGRRMQIPQAEDRPFSPIETLERKRRLSDEDTAWDDAGRKASDVVD